MLGKNEHIHIRRYFCETFVDDYENGEDDEVVTYWNGAGRPSESGKYESVEDALCSIMEKDNYLEWNGMENWSNFFAESGMESERGRFDTTILVDEDNCKPSESDKKEWMSGKRKLYALHITVYLAIRSEREFSDEEHKELL